MQHPHVLVSIEEGVSSFHHLLFMLRTEQECKRSNRCQRACQWNSSGVKYFKYWPYRLKCVQFYLIVESNWANMLLSVTELALWHVPHVFFIDFPDWTLSAQSCLLYIQWCTRYTWNSFSLLRPCDQRSKFLDKEYFSGRPPILWDMKRRVEPWSRICVIWVLRHLTSLTLGVSLPPIRLHQTDLNADRLLYNYHYLYKVKALNICLTFICIQT